MQKICCAFAAQRDKYGGMPEFLTPQPPLSTKIMPFSAFFLDDVSMYRYEYLKAPNFFYMKHRKQPSHVEKFEKLLFRKMKMPVWMEQTKKRTGFDTCSLWFLDLALVRSLFYWRVFTAAVNKAIIPLLFMLVLPYSRLSQSAMQTCPTHSGQHPALPASCRNSS